MRKFSIALVVMLLIGGVVLASRTKEHLTPAEAFAIKIDKALDSMEKPKIDVSLAQLYVAEITPYFGYEGISQSGQIGDEQVTVVMDPAVDGMSHNHILGWTYCNGTVFLNARFLNPVSTWYEREEFLGTLVHEMIHNLGGAYCSLDSVQAESRTQLGMLETLAALANGGNKLALYSLLYELRDVALATAEFEALQKGDIGHYVRFEREHIFPGDAVEASRLQRSLRFWRSRMGELKGILNRYNRLVYNDWQDFKYDTVDAFGAFTVQMNDLKYILDHLDEMVENV